MRRKSCFLVLGLCFMASVAFATTLKVVTQEAVIRKDKQFFSPPVARAPFGSVVQQLGREGDWFRVGYQGTQGWVHISTVQEQKFQPSSLVGGQAAETSRDEVALAGKGFTPEVEKAFREKNPRMRYDLVDRVQSYKVDEDRLQAFIRAGNLTEPGGAP